METEHIVQIVCSILEMVGVVAAAIVAARTVKKTVESHFFKYKDGKHDLYEIMRLAKKEIVIIANCGHSLLKNYFDDLAHCMEHKNIKVKFLILDIDSYMAMDTYVTGESPQKEKWEESVQMLEHLQMRYPNQLEVRTFQPVLTASYIAVDLDAFCLSESHSVIQMMPYLYHKQPDDSLSMYIDKNGANKEYFNDLADTIRQIWNDGKPFCR